MQCRPQVATSPMRPACDRRAVSAMPSPLLASTRKAGYAADTMSSCSPEYSRSSTANSSPACVSQ